MKNIRSIIPIILAISFIGNIILMTVLMSEKEARCHDLEVLDAKIKAVYALNRRTLPVVATKSTDINKLKDSVATARATNVPF